MITSQIIQTIKEKAESVAQIQEVLMHPEGADIIEIVNDKPVYKGTRITKYPAVVFVKDTMSAEFLDSGSNMRTVAFKAWVLVPCANTENIDVWERILPNAVDAVMSVFDVDWNFGTIGGHRVWARMASGIQGYTPEPDGRVAWEELSLIVKYAVDAQ